MGLLCQTGMLQKTPDEVIIYLSQQVDFIRFFQNTLKYSAHHSSSKVTELFHSEENWGRPFSSHHSVLLSGLKSVMCIAQPW